MKTHSGETDSPTRSAGETVASATTQTEQSVSGSVTAPTDGQRGIIPEELARADEGGNRFLNSIGANSFIKVLLLDSPVGAYEWWTEEKDGKRKPHRVPCEGGNVPEGVDARFVWLAKVLDLGKDRAKAWVVGQKSIRKEITRLDRDPDYDLTKCPLKVTREGSGKESTSYKVDALPEINLTEEQRAEAGTPCRLEALFEDGDPFDCDNIPF